MGGVGQRRIGATTRFRFVRVSRVIEAPSLADGTNPIRERCQTCVQRQKGNRARQGSKLDRLSVGRATVPRRTRSFVRPDSIRSLFPLSFLPRRLPSFSMISPGDATVLINSRQSA